MVKYRYTFMETFSENVFIFSLKGMMTIQSNDKVLGDFKIGILERERDDGDLDTGL